MAITSLAPSPSDLGIGEVRAAVGDEDEVVVCDGRAVDGVIVGSKSDGSGGSANMKIALSLLPLTVYMKIWTLHIVLKAEFAKTV